MTIRIIGQTETVLALVQDLWYRLLCSGVVGVCEHGCSTGGWLARVTRLQLCLPHHKAQRVQNIRPLGEAGVLVMSAWRAVGFRVLEASTLERF